MVMRMHMHLMNIFGNWLSLQTIFTDDIA